MRKVCFIFVNKINIFKGITSWNPQKSVIYDENVSNDMNCA